MKIVLGVVDVAYTDSKEAETTGDVAELLEEKYGVMQTFFDLHQSDIVKALENGIAGAIENTLAGKESKADVFLGAYGNIENQFHNYIDFQEHGIRLKKQDAPLAGPRKKRQYKKVEATLPFVATGLYRQMFKVWIEK